jgi:hypothetical protein
MMIHILSSGVNTFYEQNVLIFGSRQDVTDGVSRPGQRSIQQTATGRAYESTELRPGILSGKVASPFPLRLKLTIAISTFPISCH